jgi:hypothetical protein
MPAACGAASRITHLVAEPQPQLTPDQREQQLAWEARQRPRAAAAAIIGALASLVSDLWTSSILRGAPKGSYLESLEHATQPGTLGSQTSLRTSYFQFISDHSSALVATNVIKAISYLGIAWALTFLIVATRARRAQVARPVVYVALVGSVLSAVAAIMFWAAYTGAVDTFLSGPHTVDRAADAGNGSALMTAQFIGLAGQLALAVGYVFVSLNAMRAGLLTKFMGIVGVIAGALVIIPLGPQVILQPLWLAALAALFLGRWPQGMPPAWASGQEEPWPSGAEAAAARREAAQARRGGGGRGRPAPAPAAPAPAPADEAPRPVPERAKRKRKRR